MKDKPLSRVPVPSSSMGHTMGRDTSLPPKQPIVEPPSVGVPPPPRVKKPVSDMFKLRERAKRAAAKARATIPVQLKVHTDEYKALVELCEKYHMPISTIARQCMIDGMRKYTDNSIPGRSPFPLSPSRAFPEFTPKQGATIAAQFEGDDEYDPDPAPKQDIPEWALPSTGPLEGEYDLPAESEQSE